MASALLSDPDDPHGPRRRSSPVRGRVLAAGGVVLVLAAMWMLTTRVTVTDRPNKVRTTQVIIPPPPPPPPPEPVVQEKPPEPVPTPVPMEQPQDTPPPPEAKSSEPTVGDNALTAREGAGPSNYGLARGDGSGGRIGGKPGGGISFAAYGAATSNCLVRRTQADRELTRGRFVAQLKVAMAPDGKVSSVQVLESTDPKRNARLEQVLTGHACTPPPAGLPVMLIEISGRSGA
jgi:periplasmic protein TonB